MTIRTRCVAHRSPWVRALTVAALAGLVTACSALPGPDPTPSGSASPAVLAPPATEFAPLASGATKGLGTGANDFDTGLATTDDLVVASGIVYGNRLAPAFRYSTDGGASWQLGRLSEASQRETPPDQGDQTSGVAVANVAGQQRWVAFGEDWRQTLTWTSTDGKTWDRHVPAADQIPTEADVSDIAAVPEGFVLVGTDVKGKPTAWTSVDGISWRRSAMGGDGTPAAVASQGSTVVAVGSHDDTYATWLSNDRGRTWHRGSKPAKPADDDDFSRRLDDISATGDGFVVVGSYFAKEWEPVAYRSSTGRTWAATKPPPGAKGGSDSTLVRAADGAVVVGTVEYAPGTLFRLFAQSGGRWREARTPISEGLAQNAGEWYLGDVVRSDKAWIAAAQLSRNGQIVSQLWRSTDEGKTFTTVDRPVAELDQPTALPVALVRAGTDTYVFGDSRRRPVVWHRSSTEPFGTPELVSGDASDRITGAAQSPRTVLTFGTRTAGGTEFAVVWRRAGQRWVATDPGTFSAADRRYASSSISQVVWLRNRWVAVGETSDNGDLNSSALVATSTDGATWTPGKPARTMAKAGGDVWFDVTDLQGDHDRTRAMYDVTAVGDQLLAVGDSAEGTADRQGQSATVWRSDDARTWTMQRLPLNGLDWSSMDQVVVRGSTVVVLGTGATAQGSPTVPVVWRSADRGRTWRQQLLDAAHTGGVTMESRNNTARLVALRSGFAVVGEKIDGTSRPVAFLSEDGAAWRPLELTSTAGGPGSGTIPQGALADGDDLWLLVRTTNAAGAGTRVVVQPTR